MSTADIARAGEENAGDDRQDMDRQDVDRGDSGASDRAGDPEATRAETTPADAAASSESRPLAESGAGAQSQTTDEADSPLLEGGRVAALREQWLVIQGGFVDEPRDAVGRADALIAEVIQELARNFASERENLERQWGNQADVDTEDLRIALRHYRSFMNRLLAA